MALTFSFIGLAGQTPGHQVITLSFLGLAGQTSLVMGRGGWTRRGWVSFIIKSLKMARFGGLVMENLEGLVEGGGLLMGSFG